MHASTMSLTRLFVAYRRPFIFALHIGLIALSSYCALSLRFDGDIPSFRLQWWFNLLPWLILIRSLVFIPFRLYEGLWRYTGIWDLRNIALSILCSTVLFMPVVYFSYGWNAYPRSVMVIDALLLMCLSGGLRLIGRLYRTVGSLERKKSVLIYGAGDAGETIVRDMKNNGAHRYQPIGFVDDDPAKTGNRIHGVRVLGTRETLPKIIAREQVDEVLVAMTQATSAVIRDIVKMLEPYKIPLTTLPRFQDILEGRVTINQIRKLDIADLLPRQPVSLNAAPLHDLLTGKRVLITGAGGSIGSEISRQVAAFNPHCLILFERHENSLYEIRKDLLDNVLCQDAASPRLECVLGDITDAERVHALFASHRPEIVFHAAAHKHVPLVEDNPAEAVKNNILGTRTVAQAADLFGAERFVLISSDKAVSPSSVMGATKRVGEMLLQMLPPNNRTRFMAVRFGNVLGSSGSVVPRFLEQIKDGGPVTVTHPEMRRYFMLIPEAVQLVLHAAALGVHRTVYVLEMGESIKILDLARNLIRLSGYIPEEEIPITCVGQRPGEKLCEELMEHDEIIHPSEIEAILQVNPGLLPKTSFFSHKLLELEKLVSQGEQEAVLTCLQELVPTFKPLAFTTLSPKDVPRSTPFV
jgi:FlaA1/EpsC-like NDP-sugar epimerase